MKRFRLSAFACILALAACTSSPTESVRPDPPAPSLGTAAVSPPAGGMSDATTSSDSTAARGGASMGSGN